MTFSSPKGCWRSTSTLDTAGTRSEPSEPRMKSSRDRIESKPVGAAPGPLGDPCGSPRSPNSDGPSIIDAWGTPQCRIRWTDPRDGGRGDEQAVDAQ